MASHPTTSHPTTTHPRATTTAGDPRSSDSTAEAPPIFDLSDHGANEEPADTSATGNGGDAAAERPRGNGDRTLVLGGAAAAEGRTTGPNPRIGGPVPAEPRTPAGGNGRPGGRR